MSQIELYSYYRSSCSYRVRIVLHHKKIPFTYKSIHLVKKEQNQDSYRDLNPMGQVPCLVIEGKTFNQSLSILQVLEDKNPQPPFLPSNPEENALMIELVEIINSGTQPLQNLKVLHYLEESFSCSSEKLKKWCAFWIQKGLEAFGERAKETAKTFCLGNNLTWADVFLIPQLYNARRFQVPLDHLKHLLDIEKNCLGLDSFQKAHPDHQPDSPENP